MNNTLGTLPASQDTYQSDAAINLYSDVFSRGYFYKDFDLRMTMHPITGALNIIKDENAVKRSLYNLLMTEPGEKPFNSEYGVPLNSMLFNLTQLNPMDIDFQIRHSIQLFEPRIKIQKINITRLPNEVGIEIAIEFSINTLHSEQTFQIQLKRLR